MQFCEKLYALRQERGLTQKQVGEALSMAARQYQRFEKGEQKPGFDNLRNRPVTTYHGVGATLVVAPRFCRCPQRCIRRICMQQQILSV